MLNVQRGLDKHKPLSKSGLFIENCANIIRSEIAIECKKASEMQHWTVHGCIIPSNSPPAS